MSALITCESQMKNRKELIAALEQIGVPSKVIRTSSGDEKLNLQGYGRQKGEVDVLIKNAEFHNGYGDVGFNKNSAGTFDVLVDDLDDVGALKRKVKAPKSFTASLKQHYSALVVAASLRKQGFFPSIKQDGTKLKVVARSY